MPRTRKFISKRIKVTKTGKLMRRGSGQSHYNAKKPAKKVRSRHKERQISKSDIKPIKRHFYL